MRWRTLATPDDGALDRVAAAAILGLGLFEAFFATTVVRPWGQALLTLGWALPLVWRLRWPVAVLALVVPLGPALGLVNSEGGVTSYVLAVILAAFTVGRHRDPPGTWWGPVLCVGFFYVGYAIIGGSLTDYVFTALLYGSAWGVGYALRQRAERIDDLHQQAEDLRQHQAEREQRAIADERARIARELHDIVSHSISVITILALDSRPQPLAHRDRRHCSSLPPNMLRTTPRSPAWTDPGTRRTDRHMVHAGVDARPAPRDCTRATDFGTEARRRNEVSVILVPEDVHEQPTTRPTSS